MRNISKGIACAALWTCAALFGAQETLLRDDWFFKKADLTLAEVCSPQVELADWQRVRLPHDAAAGGPFDMTVDRRGSLDGNAAALVKLKTGATGGMSQFGVGWYRRTLSLPESDRGKSVYVRFDGAMSGAKVYLNGELVCERPYGYATFEADLTKHFKFGEDNLLAVRLDNPEASSRWYTGFGLYRKATLVVRDAVRVPFGGIFVTTPEVSTASARIRVETELENVSGKPVEVVLESEIRAPDGKIVAAMSTPATLGEKTAHLAQETALASPELWGIETPNLYTLVVRVRIGGTVCDENAVRFGVRSIRFDANEGFFLNGVRTKIKGLGQHHDFGPLGAAFDLSAARRLIGLLKDVGANAVRTVHNPPAPEWLDLCDENGILVMDEGFDEWEREKCPNGYHRLFKQWADVDLRDWIRRDRNHPSVIMWSLGNEIPDQTDALGAKNAKRLACVAKQTDSTRPTTAAINGKVLEHIGGQVDLLGCNYQQRVYPQLHERFPEKPIYGSETAAMLSSRGVYALPHHKALGTLESELQISSYCDEMRDWPPNAEEEWDAQDAAFVCGEFSWSLTDYVGEPYPFEHSTLARSSYWGLCDLAGLKKDRYYLYRSHWNETSPTLHVLPHWTWPEMEGKTLPVHVFTSYKDVALFVNGKLIGRKQKDGKRGLARYRIMFEDVPYEAGELKAVAYDDAGKVAAECVVKTAGKPAAIRLMPETRCVLNDGREVCVVEVSIVDKEGVVCPRANDAVFFRVQGNGRLRAVCNGDATDQIPFSASYGRAFSGKLVAMVDAPSLRGDKLRLTAWGGRLKGTSVDIEVKE